VVVATKAGFCLGSLGWVAKHLKPMLRRVLRLRPGFAGAVRKVRATQQKQDFSAPYLQRSVEASLRRLDREAIDLFFLHSPPTEVLRSGEALDALEKLKSHGKLRHYGVSCRTAEDAKLCLDLKEVEVLQVELSPLTSRTLEELLPPARKQATGIVARQALAGGLLLRPATELRPDDCEARGWDFNEAKACLSVLDALMRETGSSRLEIALQFLLQVEGCSSVLTGTTSLDHLQEQLAALERPALPADLLARLRPVHA
jgi:aryl-alcohol dehydrogenase-like predicted oxidoreductase